MQTKQKDRTKEANKNLLPLGGHRLLHFSSVSKLFSLPKQPPYLNCLQRPAFE